MNESYLYYRCDHFNKNYPKGSIIKINDTDILLVDYFSVSLDRDDFYCHCLYALDKYGNLLSKDYFDKDIKSYQTASVEERNKLLAAIKEYKDRKNKMEEQPKMTASSLLWLFNQMPTDEKEKFAEEFANKFEIKFKN